MNNVELASMNNVELASMNNVELTSMNNVELASMNNVELQASMNNVVNQMIMILLQHFVQEYIVRSTTSTSFSPKFRLQVARKSLSSVANTSC